MSELGLMGDDRPTTPAGGRRAERRRRRGPGCLIALVILAVLGGAGYWGVTTGIEKVKDQFSSADDYSGPGEGEVVYEVKTGDTATAIGRGLKAAGVVASVDAFIAAANANPQSANIQAGAYSLREQMKASDAVAVLVDPSNIVKTTVTIPEGLQVREIVALLAKNTDFSKAEFQSALKDPGLGLPAYADGDPEGYLFPATYDFGPDAQPLDMLKQMVARWQQAATDNGLEAKAAELGYTPGEIMTIASLIEAEGRGSYKNQISRVIYNRLENPGNGITNGLLQIDASVNYALGKSGSTALTTAEIQSVSDSPYNTYTEPGLPPTPIEAPGDESIQAALNPEAGDWLFYVTVDLKTGETKFTDSYQEFLEFKDEYQNYCATESDRC
ncbi:endolytic transglycosylase MltG [Nocardioides flavescens]|uniref:Endolytic murein transglycosylase n=1 Tax=Nocardioides flavescens TaxID=2691959 RepID=A0A6L7EXU1_9ACTN|nr:endolytic transglycosylase MltG [Nocardioides flavescens]MXG90696.1 endolytic transglycosylase MltG [Nocardioides flavescens]